MEPNSLFYLSSKQVEPKEAVLVSHCLSFQPNHKILFYNSLRIQYSKYYS